LKVIWSPLAIDRAVEQAHVIAQDKPGAAARWLDGVFDATESLADLPKLGRMVPELKKEDHRELSYGSYRIIYRIDAKQISILTVRHSRRLLDRAEIDG